MTPKSYYQLSGHRVHSTKTFFWREKQRLVIMDNLETIYNNNKKNYYCINSATILTEAFYQTCIIQKNRERRCNVSCWKHEKTSGVKGWNLETMRRRDGFGRFLTRQRPFSWELVMFSGVSLNPSVMLSSGCQALELRERVHGGARC